MKILWDRNSIEREFDRLNFIQNPLRFDILKISILSLSKNNNRDDFSFDCHGAVAHILGLTKVNYITALDALRLSKSNYKNESLIGDIHYFYANEMVSHSAIVIAKENGIDVLWSKLGIENGIGIGSADDTFANYVKERKSNIPCMEYNFSVDEMMRFFNR
jgi:hypothetical protein